MFGYSNKELQKKAEGEKVFPHVFGTDDQGRDIMVRVMVGARVSIIVGVCAALLVLVIGALYGSISGYCGGMVDTVMQRIVEIIYSIPEMLIILLLSATLKTGTGTVPELRDGIFQSLVTLWTKPDLYVHCFWSSVLGNHEPYHPWTDPAVKTAGICNSSQSTWCQGRTYHQQTSASELYRTDRYDYFPADPVSNLPGILLILPGCWCISTAYQSGIHVFRSTERTENLSIPTVHSGSDLKCYDPVSEPVW